MYTYLPLSKESLNYKNEYSSSTLTSSGTTDAITKFRLVRFGYQISLIILIIVSVFISFTAHKERIPPNIIFLFKRIYPTSRSKAINQKKVLLTSQLKI